MEDLIKKKKKEIREEIYIFKKNKEEELFNFCLNHGGHFFYEWQKFWIDMLFKECSHWELRRKCRFCGFEESQKIEKE